MESAAHATASRRVKIQPDAMFRAAADQAPEVMWIVNAKGAVTYLNQAWYELVGGMPPQWYGHEWTEAVDPEDVAQMRQRWKLASATGTTFEGTRRVRSRAGAWHTLSYRAVPVFDSSGLLCWVGIDSDITELLASQAALRLANQELEAFSRTVSHDLRAPLVTVQGFSERLATLLQHSDDAKARHYAQRIGAAVTHLGELVDGLLLLSQVARHRVRHEAVDITAIAREVADMLMRGDSRRQGAIEIEPGLVAKADRRLIAALLENLLGNAWKFTSKTSTTDISVGRASATASELTFFVRDNGAGFDMANSGKLFTAFERLHSADEFPGTGIGLATVHRIVTLHGGRVWAESQPGVGSCFYFAIPQFAVAGRTGVHANGF